MNQRGPLDLTSLEIEAGFRPLIDELVTNVTAEPMMDGRGWTIRGDSTQGTDLVATFARCIYRDDNAIVARHIRLDVEPLFRDQGYAKALLRSSFSFYQRIGVAFVDMEAVGDGLLVWSRLGFSLHGAGIDQVHAELQFEDASMHGERPPESFQLPFFGPSIYDLEDEDGNRIGFQALRKLAYANTEVKMRLRLDSPLALAVLREKDIL